MPVYLFLVIGGYLFLGFAMFYSDEIGEHLYLARERRLSNVPENNALNNLADESSWTPEYKEWMEKMKTEYQWDDTLGFMHYEPYAGGNKFDVETITEKPGFKVWVDGGVIDYAQRVCYAKNLDCSKTCCKQSYCAPTKADCINYKRRPYMEVYIGIFVVTMIVAGIPTCILTVEFVLNFKFCARYDDQVEMTIGGMTLCEATTYALTCGKSDQAPESVQDNYIEQFKIKYKDELAAAEANYAYAPGPKTYEEEKPKSKVPPSTFNSSFHVDNETYPENTALLGVSERRGCLKRCICLLFCCDTSDMTLSSNLSKLNDIEIQMYSKELQ